MIRRVLVAVTLIASVCVGTMLPANATSSYDAIVLGAQPVAYWALNGNVQDTSGHGHNGSFVNGTPASASMPNGDGAVDFNGTNQYATIPTFAQASISTAHALTWEGWIRPDVLQFPSSGALGYVDWLGKCITYNPTCEWEARMYNQSNSQGRISRLSAYAFNVSGGLGSAADWQPTTGYFAPGQWLYVVGEYQTSTTPSVCSSVYPGSLNIWVNGVGWNFAKHGTTGCMSAHSVIPTASTSPVTIGTMAKDTWFKGAVAKVALYDRLLTPAEIASHYAAMRHTQVAGACADSCTLAPEAPTMTIFHAEGSGSSREVFDFSLPSDGGAPVDQVEYDYATNFSLTSPVSDLAQSSYISGPVQVVGLYNATTGALIAPDMWSQPRITDVVGTIAAGTPYSFVVNGAFPGPDWAKFRFHNSNGWGPWTSTLGPFYPDFCSC